MQRKGVLQDIEKIEIVRMCVGLVFSNVTLNGVRVFRFSV